MEIGSNPLLADTDGDSLSDNYELENGLDPLDDADCPSWLCPSMPRALLLAMAGSFDLDKDGLTRQEEEALERTGVLRTLMETASQMEMSHFSRRTL